MKRTLIYLTPLLLVTLPALRAQRKSPPYGEPTNAKGAAAARVAVARTAFPNVTDWLHEVRLGVFMHFWPNSVGDMNLVEPFGVLPGSRWVDGSPWHALTYLGASWGHRNVRYPTERWIQWVKAVTEKGGCVTLDMGPNGNAQAGPIGLFSEAQAAQFRAIRQALPPEAAITRGGNLP